MLKALLFDLDGTLTNTDRLHYRTWRDVLRDYDLHIDETFYQANFSGRLNQQIVADLLPHLSVAAGKALSDRKEAEFRARANLLEPLPGLMDLLAWLGQQGLPQGIVTNAPRANAEFMLQALDLQHQFAPVVLAEELPRGKPDPLPYQTGLHLLGVEADQALVFEDSPSGIRSAVAAGITTVGIASTHPPQSLYELGSTLVIADFTDPRLHNLLQERLIYEQPGPYAAPSR